MSDSLWSSRLFRTINVIDEYNRDTLRIEIYTCLPVARGIRVLDELVVVRGLPLPIRLKAALTSSPTPWSNGRNT